MVLHIIRAVFFFELRSIFPSPEGARKNASNERVLYAKRSIKIYLFKHAPWLFMNETLIARSTVVVYVAFKN